MIRASELAALCAVGRYGTDELLASGESGTIFHGYDPALCRPVTIKVLRSELAKDYSTERQHESFKRRARAACQLFHPNIPTTFDFGEDCGMSFVVMEDIDGFPLDRLLNTAGPLAPRRAITILRQVLEALGYSYSNRVLHLDLKPSVVFVSDTDHVKVVDFGVALVNASEPLSIDEILPATRNMTPEQLTGASVDDRTDLFAAGALLFEMLTCTRPFSGRTLAEILRQMEAEVPEDVCALNASVSPALRSVIETALSYDPADRFATAAAFSDALGESMPLGDRYEVVTRSASSRAEKREGDSQVAEHRWDPEILHRVAADLAMYIGPVAAIAVTRAAKRSQDLSSLYMELSVYVNNEKDREQFLASVDNLTAATLRQVGIPNHDTQKVDSAQRRSKVPDPPDPAVLKVIEARLAEHLGPIARVLIDQQLQNFQGLSELCRGLADRISDGPQRAAFLNLAEFNATRL